MDLFLWGYFYRFKINMGGFDYIDRGNKLKKWNPKTYLKQKNSKQ